MKQLERAAAIGAPILTAIAILLLAFSFFTSEPAADEPVIIGGATEGVSNFDDLAVSGDLDVGDDLTFWAGNVYPLGSETNDLAVYAATATFSGTLDVGAATHGLTSIVAAFCTLGQTPGTGAGAPAHCWTSVSALTATLTVEQDDWTTNATSAAVVEYLLIGAP